MTITGSTGVRRIAVVNRGEAAMRLVNAVRELRHETGQDIRSIALHTDAERRAMFVREADEAVCIDAGRDSAATGSPYLDLSVLEAALVAARADAAWVGWGFVAERPEFAELCDRLGVTFIGPRPDVMRRLGDKIGAKLLAEEAGVPVAEWSGGPVDSLAAAIAAGERIGYPLMIKATAGGGGRGIRRVDGPEGLAEAFDSARNEGAKAFGDPTVFMERVVTGARHVEVQLIGDEHGTVWALGVRDCSLQRRNQKVIEESHCVAITPDQDRELRAAAVRLAKLAGYTNAGTVEFLYSRGAPPPVDPPTSPTAGDVLSGFAFLEVNTRLQVEHPVTELTTGVDLVKLQLHVASGGALPHPEPPAPSGYAIEARLNAEDPQRGFAPSPGTIETLTFPVGSGVRVDTGVAEGDVIPPEYDSMIAKIIASGRDRDEAMARLRRALEQTVALVRGGTTNKSFLLGLLERPEVLDSTIDTAWLDRLTATDEHLVTRHADVALVAAAVDAALDIALLEQQRFFGTAARGRAHADSSIGHEVELRHGAHSYRIPVRTLGTDRFAVRLGRDEVDVRVDRLTRTRSRLVVDGRSFVVIATPPDCDDTGDFLVEVDGVTHRFSRDEAGVVRAPAAALVVGVDVAPGDEVVAGQRLAVVEAMKMELAINAPVDGRVGEVFVTRNTQVDAGAPLVRVEPSTTTSDDQTPATPALTLAQLVGPTAAEGGAGDTAATLRGFMLGFDVGPAAARSAAAAISCRSPHDDADVEALGLFADLCSLSPERRDPEAVVTSTPRELFSAYLRSLDAEREGLPSWFVDRISRAVAHYGVGTLDVTAELQAALVRIAIAHHRRDEQLGVVTALLEDRLSGAPATEDPSRLRDALDRLIESTQRRHPSIASLARGVRYRYFDRPVIEAHQSSVRSEMRTVLSELTAPGVDAATAAARADTLVACPLPLMALFTEGDRFGTTDDPGPLLAILTRRYYKIRTLEDLRVETVDGFAVVRAMYRHNGRIVHVIALRARPGELADALDAASAAAGDVSLPDTAVVDVYACLPPADDRSIDVIAGPIEDAVAASALPGLVRRVAVIAARPDGSASLPLTFRRAGDDGVRPYWMLADVADDENARRDRFREDVKFRGLHPMIARRLQMWRLANFEISRLPSADDVYAFNCVARDTASDERLVAVAEVRDLTPVRDDAGRVVALPGVEHVLVGCLDAIRQALARRSDGRRLEWNRVMLYVWPPVDFGFDEVRAIARRLTPLTEGLGIEQVVVSARFASPDVAEPIETVLRLGYEPGRGLTVRVTEPPAAPMQPLDEYTRKNIQARRRGLVYPYELIPLLAGRGGSFVEYDLDDTDRLVPVDRDRGLNKAGVVVGIVSTPTARYPEGVTRVAICGDPTKAMGAITEAECRRILGAIDLAEERDIPIEWFALSAGAKIAMDSGSENLDWVATVLRRLVEHTQPGGRDGGRVGGRVGGEVNVVVAGINVGAQPYWNAEATMLMHTSGILVMTPDSAMVLTGKQAIDYSGGVSAEDNLGIGGYARVMGPNGEAQYFAPTIAAACDVLFDHYELTYRAPGERWPRPAATDDPRDRDAGEAVHTVEGSEFTTVGAIFSDSTNRDRKKPFDVRTVMGAVLDADRRPLERWAEMAEAEMAVVYDGRLGGHAVSMIGIESRPLPRHGSTPADGPAQWSAGTLFPLSSKKVARAINAASGRRPVVVLANLSGFDGSPESLRRLQLEYGAEIGRAIVNFEGPFVLCVISRYHGGAFVVFSARLNDDMEVLAVEGSFASVIGGAPAAAVVFTREVDERTGADPRVKALEAKVAGAAEDEANVRRAELAETRDLVRAEKLGEVAAEFDRIHSVERAQAVGSVHRIIDPTRLRPELIEAVERGLAKIDARR
ncbi:biotin carboxylase N-terminal domain-containing protein [Desertimonas flava]|uniref:ATP-binding protein n=1 Tax=Desertimonas flava TaxID=2064846 RepID=UPI0023F50091|nr:biotin carboxylase N-terminal domain-containing protein [Desertimonas flava]